MGNHPLLEPIPLHTYWKYHPFDLIPLHTFGHFRPFRAKLRCFSCAFCAYPSLSLVLQSGINRTLFTGKRSRSQCQTLTMQKFHTTKGVEFFSVLLTDTNEFDRIFRRITTRTGRKEQMNKSDRDFIEDKVFNLLKIVNDLEKRFEGRRFTLDGHLFGSIGEVLAVYYYGVDLYPSGVPVHDGEKDGKKVQIKITQGDTVDIKTVPEHLLVLFLHKQDVDVNQKDAVYEVYNGPCEWLNDCKKNNGEYHPTLVRLLKEDSKILPEDRLTTINPIRKWTSIIKNI